MLVQRYNTPEFRFQPGVRKPFGEMTNTPPPKPATPKPQTPAAAAASSTPNEEAALTPMANLKLLMKVNN